MAPKPTWTHIRKVLEDQVRDLTEVKEFYPNFMEHCLRLLELEPTVPEDIAVIEKIKLQVAGVEEFIKISVAPSGRVSKFVDAEGQTEISELGEMESLRNFSAATNSYEDTVIIQTSTPTKEYILPARSNISFFSESLDEANALDGTETPTTFYSIDKVTALKIASIDNSITLEELLTAELSITTTSSDSKEILVPETQELLNFQQTSIGANETATTSIPETQANLNDTSLKLVNNETTRKRTSEIGPKDFNFDAELISELEHLVHVRVLLDLFHMDIMEGHAITLPSCYSSLSEGEKKIVDKLTVGYFINKLIRGGELIPGTIDELKPTNKCSNNGTSKKRPMHEEEYKEFINITNRICRDTLQDWTPDAAKYF